jgi:hypothetical protein
MKSTSLAASRPNIQVKRCIIDGTWAMSSCYVEQQRNLSRGSVAQLIVVCHFAFPSGKIYMNFYSEYRLEVPMSDIVDVRFVTEGNDAYASFTFASKKIAWFRKVDPKNAVGKWAPYEGEPPEPFMRRDEPDETMGHLCIWTHGKPTVFASYIAFLRKNAASYMPKYLARAQVNLVPAITSAQLDKVRTKGCKNCDVGTIVLADVYCSACGKTLCQECDRVLHRSRAAATSHQRFPLLSVPASTRQSATAAPPCECAFAVLNGTCGESSDCPCAAAGYYCRPQRCKCVGCFNPFNYKPK